MNAPIRHSQFDFGESVAKGGVRPVSPEIGRAGAALNLRRKTIGWYVDDIVADPMTIPAMLLGGGLAIMLVALVVVLEARGFIP